MLNNKKIFEVAKVAKLEKWPFPKTVDALKGLGVHSYDVDFLEKSITYRGKVGTVKESDVSDLAGLFISHHTFNGDALKKALIHHQMEKTSYGEILKEMISAGVERYTVDMLKRTCTYYGKQKGESLTEQVPEWVE